MNDVIPKKLHKEDFRFVKVQRGKKYPFENDWQDTNNYKYDDEEFVKHVKDEGNYGVVCGFGDLVVIDCDKEKVTKAVKNNLPETFEVRTGSGGSHFYFICKDIEKPIRLKEEKMGDLGDVQYEGKQVVGPGSLHPNGSHYKLVRDTEIAKVNVSQIRKALKEFTKDTQVKEQKERNRKRMKDRGIEELDIRDVVDLSGLNKRGDEFQGAHPLHGSTTGQNFCVNPLENVWHCFRHDTGGGPLSWVAIKEGIIDCSDAVPRALEGDKFREVLRVAEDRYGLEVDYHEELTDNLIKRLKKRLKENNYQWGSDTKYVVFKDEVKLGVDDKIERNEVRELPAKLVEDLKEKDIVSEKLWLCVECEETMESDYKPPACSNCDNNSKKNIRALHPYSAHEIGDVLVKEYHFATVRESMGVSDPGAVHLYTGGVYRKDGVKGFIRHQVKQMRHNSNPNLQREVINHVATLSDIPEEKFGIEGKRVVLKNGVLDLDDMTLGSHDPDYYALSEMDVEYNPHAECPKFKEYLKEDIPSEKDRKRLQELLGTALVNKKMHKKGGIVVGPTDSGKSTLIKIIRKVFGEENVSSQDPHSLVDTRWGKAKLRTSMLNATDEVHGRRLRNLALLKKIMDGNPISAERKGERVFEFSPTCEHLFAANQTPSAERGDDAFWNRWIVIEMPEKVPDEEKDEDLPKRILEEKPGILNWIIEGFKDYIDNGKKFTYQQSWEDSRDKWLNWGDSMQRFIQKFIEREDGNKISASELHDKYSEYAREDTNMEVESQKNLTEAVKELGFVSYSSNYVIDGKKQRGFKGIKATFGDEEEDDTDEEEESGENNLDVTFSKFEAEDDESDEDEVTLPFGSKVITFIEDNFAEGEFTTEELYEVWKSEKGTDNIDKLRDTFQNLIDNGKISEVRSDVFKFNK